MAKFSGDTPTLADLIRAGVEEGQQNTWTALLGKIKSYDAAKQCASAEPVTRVYDAAGEVRDLPPISCMPVLFPSGGGYSISWKLQPGDQCLIVFTSISSAQYLASGEEGATPESPRRNSLSDGVIIPGVRPFNNALSGPGAAEFSAGKDDGTVGLSIDAAGLLTIEAPASIKIGAGATSKVALDTLVASQLSDIATAFNTHTHTGVTTGPGTSGTVAVPPYIPGSTAATKTSAE